MNVGYRWQCTSSRSTTLERTGVIEIGRKSANCVGDCTLATGRMMAVFHCAGTCEAASDRLMSSDNTLEYAGAVKRRNHAAKQQCDGGGLEH